MSGEYLGRWYGDDWTRAQNYWRGRHPPIFFSGAEASRDESAGTLLCLALFKRRRSKQWLAQLFCVVSCPCYGCRLIFPGTVTQVGFSGRKRVIPTDRSNSSSSAMDQASSCGGCLSALLLSERSGQFCTRRGCCGFRTWLFK